MTSKREIKFRGQKSATKEWIYGSLIVSSTGNHSITQINENPNFKGILQGWCFGIINGTEGQFTGLKDKNGVDIYENDIVSESSKLGWKNKVVKMEYFQGSDEMGIDTYGYPAFDNTCEVIGNIHENKELI